MHAISPERNQTISAFAYWTDGSTQLEAIPALEEGEQKPWIVHSSRSSYIVFNLLVFAATPEGAIRRVREAIEEVVAKHKRYAGGERHADGLNASFDQKTASMREAIDRAYAVPFDTRKITETPWASNDRKFS